MKSQKSNVSVYREFNLSTKQPTGRWFYEVYDPLSNRKIKSGSATTEQGAKIKAGLQLKTFLAGEFRCLMY